MNNNIFGKKKLIILNELINEKYYLREFSEKLNIPLSTLYNEIKEMQKLDMILTQKNKNRLFININYNSILTREAIRALFISKIILSSPFKKLISQKSIKKIYLFGSADKGTITKNSDVDIAIVINKTINYKTLAKFRIDLGKELNKEIQTIEIDEKKLTNDENNQTLKNVLYSTLIYESKTR